MTAPTWSPGDPTSAVSPESATDQPRKSPAEPSATVSWACCTASSAVGGGAESGSTGERSEAR